MKKKMNLRYIYIVLVIVVAVIFLWMVNKKNNLSESIDVNVISMDDFILKAEFDIKKDILNQNKRIDKIYIPNLLITDENNNIIVAEFENEEKYFEFCKKRNIEVTFTNIAYNDGTEEWEKKGENQETYQYLYITHSNQFPKSEKLKFIFNEVKIKYENNEEETIIGNWKIEKDISNETNKRESIIYDLVKSNVEGVKVTKAVTSNSVTKIELEMKWNKPVYNDTDDEVEKNKKIEEWLNEEKKIENLGIPLIEDEYIQNDEERKFFPLKSNDGDGGYTQNPDGDFFYHQTFNMSAVDNTNIIKVILPLNGVLREYFDVEQIVLELVKK